MKRINDPNDLEIIIPLEHPVYKGFFYFPDNNLIAVNKDSILLNTKTGKILKTHKHKSGRLHVTINTILPDGNYKAISYKHHRVVARTFIGRPSRHLDKPFNKLEVNHIDGNSSNNKVDNLEWCIGKENSGHCHLNYNHTKDIPILSKNLLTGEILRFNSLDVCARHYVIHKPTFHKHLKSGLSGKGFKNGCVFKLDDGTKWKEYHPCAMYEIGINNNIEVIVLNLVTGNKSIFSNINDAAKMLNINYKKLWRRLQKHEKYSENNFLVCLI